MNTSDNEIKNITRENLPQDSFSGEMIYSNEFRSMNRFLLFIVAMAMIPWIFGAQQIFYFNVTGWAWVLSALLSVLICLSNMRRISFPIGLWLPWTALLLIYWFLGLDNLNATQSFFQILSPVIVGCAASVFPSDNLQLEDIIRWIDKLAIIAWIILIIRVPMIMTGALPGYSFMAAEMIGLLLLGACYASFYACGSRRHLYYYLSMMTITIISLVRGPMAAMLACMPFTFAPLGFRKRLLLIMAAIICAIVIFNTERMQQKMFYSGSGELSDVRIGGSEMRSHGRFAMWDVLWYGVKEKPLLGNGWNAHREVLIGAGFALQLPHNDWLKIIHDIGFIGGSVYLLTMLLQVFMLVRIARISTGAHQMLAYGAATAFVPYALVMLTDNVVLYVQFFGNLHFALIGIVYGALRRETEIIYENIYY